MPSVALIGPDGAGKTTIAKTLQHSSGLRVKYLYMGASTRSSNLALPTSRLALFIKQRARAGRLRSEKGPTGGSPASYLEYDQTTHGVMWDGARLLNRLAEAWYRQLMALALQWRGYIVVYDRHILLDSAIGTARSEGRERRRLDRLFHWILIHTFPRPDLWIFMDVPEDTLYRRKAEVTREYLRNQRETYLAQGSKLKNFVRVDASRPLAQVLDEVTGLISNALRSQGWKAVEDDTDAHSFAGRGQR